MMLKIHLHGAEPYQIGPEIRQQPLTEAIQAEAETMADCAGSHLLESPDQQHRSRSEPAVKGYPSGSSEASRESGALDGRRNGGYERPRVQPPDRIIA